MGNRVQPKIVEALLYFVVSCSPKREILKKILINQRNKY